MSEHTGYKQDLKTTKPTSQDLKTTKPQEIENNKTKGQKNEQLVADYLCQKGWTIMSKNKKFFNIEVDIIARKESAYILVEVKSLKSLNYLEKIISNKQKQRLKKVTEVFIHNVSEDSQLLLATVNPQSEIQMYPLLD